MELENVDSLIFAMGGVDGLLRVPPHSAKIRFDYENGLQMSTMRAFTNLILTLQEVLV